MSHDVFRGTPFYRFAMDARIRATGGIPSWKHQRDLSRKWYDEFHASEEYQRYYEMYLFYLSEEQELWSREVI